MKGGRTCLKPGGLFKPNPIKILSTQIIYSHSHHHHHPHPILSKLESCPPNLTSFNQILTQTIATGLFHSTFAASRLLKHAPNPSLAQLLFSQIQHPDLFSYNLLIKAHSHGPDPLRSLPLFSQILVRGLRPNEYTFCFLLGCCTAAAALGAGRQVHCHIAKRGLHSATFSSTSLVHMYGGLGEIRDASRAFAQMPVRSSASWSAMIHALVDNGRAADALRSFAEMIATTSSSSSPGNAALVGAVRACAGLGDLAAGRAVHGFIVTNGFELVATLGTSFVDMYSKCGAVETAMRLFVAVPPEERNVATWNSMIHGLAMNGRGWKAVELFGEIDVRPNGVTFLGLLQACSHARLVENGVSYFVQMSELYGIEPTIKHYGCVVDLYARAGRLREAVEVIGLMPVEPDTMIWGALLGACRIHGWWELGELVAAKVMKMAPWDECGYLLLSDSFARDRRWDDVVGVRNMMREMDIRKITGCSFMCS